MSRARNTALCIAILQFVAPSTWSQAPELERRVPGEATELQLPRDAIPSAPLLQTPPRGEALPPAPQPGDQDRLSSQVGVAVREIQLTGNTVFTRKELAKLTARYENRTITNPELQALRHELTSYYTDRGYINSGAVIPDQRVVDGNIEIQIIEGRLTDIKVEGNGRLRHEFIRSRLQPSKHAPLNVNDLQERLRILLLSPTIQRVNSTLEPGDRLGEARLIVRVEEADLLSSGIVIDNHLSPSIGDAQLLLQGRLRNPSGFGDTLFAELGFAEGLNKLTMDYVVPITARDLTAVLHFDHNSADVVEDPFDEIDIESKTTSFGIEVNYPIYRTSRAQLTVGISADRRESKTSLLDESFSFSPGVQDGKSKVTVIRLFQDWLKRSPNDVMAARSTLSIGVDALNATINDSAPDGRFVAWLGQFQWARRIFDDGGQLVFRTDLQLTGDGLLPLEKFSVGGARSVRGYRENQLVRDWGFASSLEYRHPILSDQAGRSTLQLAPFADVGGAWNNDVPSVSPRMLSSIGLGLRWDPHPKVHAQLYWGHALRNVDNPSRSIQDSGFHFEVGAELF